MSHLLADEERTIVDELALSVRGPRQNGLFVLWLLLRVCGDLFPPNALTERSHRRRLLSLEKRVSSLTLPPTLRKAVRECTGMLREASPASAVAALRAVSVPVDTLGPAARGAVLRALRKIRLDTAIDPHADRNLNP